jgi:CubicO group peptidase (beta-lactamase class C family)
MIAQQAIIDLMNESFPELMDKLVFKPLGMTRSSYEQPLSAHLETNAARGHSWNGTGIPGGWHVYPEMAAAGLWTTAEDLAKLAIDFIRAWRGDASALGLSQENARMMLRSPRSEQDREYVGVGWFCSHDSGVLRCGHRGDNWGFVAEMALYPALGKGAVVLLNSNQGSPLRTEILDALGRAYDWPEAISADPDPLIGRDKDYSGSYRDESGRTLSIEQADGAIELKFDQQPALSLFPGRGGKFLTELLDLKIDFRTSAEGQITHAILIQGLGTTVFQKEVG